MTGCTAMIVDDDADMALLAKITIQTGAPEIHVAGTASSADEALGMLDDLDPDVVVVDFNMPKRNGLELAADIRRAHPGRSVILFSAYLDDTTIAAAAQVGVHTCLEKNHFHRLAAVVRDAC